MVDLRNHDGVRISFVLGKGDWERLCRMRLTPAMHLDMLNVTPHEYKLTPVTWEDEASSGDLDCSGGPTLPE